MAKEAGPLSGFRDMLAEQTIPRQRMIETIRGVYETYGFVPLDTPAIERYETLMGKYGEEGEKLMYKFEDNGGRKLALRYDLTVPLARVVAQHQAELSMPYKRYQVGNVWRGESPQAGRFREFMQFDADIVGTGSVIADAEVVAMMADTMEALGADALVRVNNRRLLDGLMKKVGIGREVDARELIGIIDKVEKTSVDEAIMRTEESFGAHTAETISDYLDIPGSTMERVQALGRLLGSYPEAQEGLENMRQVFSVLEKAGYGENRVAFDQKIARGLDYYTGIIYETTLNPLPRIGSVCSGGRFDNLIATLGGPDLPAVGTSVGVDRLFAALSELGLVKSAKTKSMVLVANFGQDSAGDYMQIASLLRRQGIAAEIYYDPDKLKKQFAFADKMGIRYMIMVGSDEKAKGLVTIKDLQAREQEQVPLEELQGLFYSRMPSATL